MSYLLDTNIVSAHLRRPAGLTHRFIQHSGRLSIPTLVLAELYAWAYGRDNPTPLLEKIRRLLDDVELLGFDQDTAERFGIIQTQLLRRGITVNPVDLMIASVALVHDLTVVTHNTKDFQNIPGLRLEDWWPS
ncbi:MAG: type II toxin-antitoxin system VapC family toxin [Candidatus Anammoximicrobium sp.]|nr:type II toxin-antitoxin system VapC family toxin [Candidatus Anammoximicrobium sp.]